MKKYAIIVLALLFSLMSCGEVLPDSSNSHPNSIYSLSKTKSEVSDYILKGINEADALNMTYKVKTFIDEDIIEITFLYVCNNSEDINSFEMSMMAFMKVNNDNEINIVKSYYNNKEFYLSLFNVSSGNNDLFKVSIDEDMGIDELVNLTGMDLFYSSPNNELFSRIDNEILSSASFAHINDYIYSYDEQNEAFLTKISVDTELTTIKVETDEFDSNSNRVQQIVTLIPKFNDSYSIEFTDNKDNYVSITLSDLGEMLTN